jgi:hypothetical protein
MSTNPDQAGRFSLRRWSQRKLEAARAEAATSSKNAPPVVVGATGQAPSTPPDALAAPDLAPASDSALQLPAIESLTIDSDFAPFFKPQVDESVKRAALKQLFRDPRFNVMDGLDTYIDDYTQPDPISAGVLEDLMQRRVSFPYSAAAAEPEQPDDAPADDRVASPDEAIAARLESPGAAEAPVAPIASPVPVARSDATITGETKALPERDAGAKSGRS